MDHQFKKSAVKKKPPSEAQTILKEEIMQLQKELESQTTLRSALEKAINFHQQPLFHESSSYQSLSKPTEDLIKEITVLELQVKYLEKCLLFLYRKTFAGKSLSSSSSPSQPSEEKLLEASIGNVSCTPTPKHKDNLLGDKSLKIEEGIIGRSQSSLSHYSASSFRAPCSPSEAFNESIDLYHSLPLTIFERNQDSSSYKANYLNEHTGSSLRIRETANYISEEMIKCISTIYCHLSDPPLIDHISIPCFSDSSSTRSFTFSPLENRCNKENPSEDFNEPLFAVFEVRGICKSPHKVDAVRELLQKHRSLISSLAHVDPGKLKHEEKLAFWINIHNSLAMHAFLVHGIPGGSLKRASLVLKAAYNIGGQTISIDMIQNSILGCRLPRPKQWLHSLLFPLKVKFKAGDVRRSFAIKHPEARLRFALCSGCQSDPSVRLYTSKAVFQELEMAKEEYIQMNVRLHKEGRLLVPKNVECFVKEMGLGTTSGFVELLEHSIRKDFRKLLRHGKLMKKIDWANHNFSFGFFLSNELVRL